MRSRVPFHIYWPQYFDMKRSRSEGRRLPKKFSVEKVSVDLVAKAARRLGYTTEIEKSLRYPRTWWDEPGRILIDTKGKKKSKVLLEVAKEIQKMRAKK